MIKKLLLLLFCISLFGSKTQHYFIDSNLSTYQDLLNKISKESNKSEDDLLKESILQEIIDTAKKEPIKIESINDANDTNSLKRVIYDYINTLQEIESLQKKIEENSKKIKAIEEEIAITQTKTTITANRLQDTLYHKKEAIFTTNLNILKKKIKKLQQIIKQSIKKVNIIRSPIVSNMDKNIKELQDIRSKITRINISIEQDEYINKTDSLSILNKKLTKLEQKYKQGAKDILADKFLIYCSYLKAKSNTVFSLQKELIESLKHYNIISQESIDDYITPFLLDLDSTYLGKLYTIAGSGKEEIQNVVHFSWKMLNAPLFHINKTPISIVKIVITLIIFLIGFIISQIYRKYIKKLSHRNRAITDSSSTLLANMGHYLIFTITFFVVLKFLGIDLSSLALVAGALSVGIGFGLQNIISNFVSGIILMIERSIKIGDYIQIDENLRGRVVDIKMRSITITTNANIDVIVPNQELIQQKVINWTMNDKICRFEIPFGVAYGSDAKKVIDTVLKAVKESGYKDIYEDRYKITRVIMTEMGNSSVNFNLFVWIKGGEVFFPKRTQSRFLVLIYEALNKNGIEIPFPQQDIHIRSIDKDIPITIKKDNDA